MPSWRSFSRTTLNSAFKEANRSDRILGQPTPNYLMDMYSAYREQIRSKYQVGLSKYTSKYDQNALALERFLNALKAYSANNDLNKLDNLSKWGSINDILTKDVLLAMINEMKQVNPHLFEYLNFHLVSSNKTEQGIIWEQTLAEVSATVEAVLAGKDNKWWNDNGKAQVQARHTGSLKDNTIDIVSPLNEASRELGEKLYHRDAYRQRINQAKQDKYFAKLTNDESKIKTASNKLDELLNNKDISLQSIQNKQIKIDATGGWILNENYSATATVPQIIIDALKDATFSAKSYQNGKYINLGGTSAIKIFMSVATGSYDHKLYRYCRMVNCLYHHHGFHDESKNYFYRIRALYELTGANQRLGQDNNVVVNQVVKGLIENPTGAKYLVINNPTAQYMGIKVIATARIADVIDNYIFFNKQYGVFGNYVKAHNYNLSAEQALNSKITLMIDYDNLYKEIQNS